MILVELAMWYRTTLKTSEEALAAWKSGKDFQILSGPYKGAYCSCRDGIDDPIMILYNNREEYIKL